jgi:hypothetical protein
VVELVAAGGKLGDLWMEGYFSAGYPLLREGAPRMNNVPCPAERNHG